MADKFLSAAIRPSSELTARVNREAGFRAHVTADSRCTVRERKTVTLRPGETFQIGGVTVIVLKPDGTVPKESGDGKAVL